MATRAAVLLLLSLHACRCEYSSREVSQHVEWLLARYERDAAPARPVPVRLALDVRHAAVLLAPARMLLLADLKMSWSDPRLAWNASQWDGDSVLVDGARLWTPDVALRSAARGGPGGAVRARLSAAGAVSLVQRLELRAPLALTLARWPRDRQQATFTFASRSHALDEVELYPSGNKSQLLFDGEWSLTEMTFARVTWAEPAGGAASGAAFTLAVTRRGDALAAAASAVLAAAALLLAAALAQPYSRRMPLVATSTLVSALWLVCAAAALGGAGGACPGAVRAAGGACAAGALAALSAALARAVSRRAAAPPRWLRALLSRLSALHSITPDPEWSAAAGGGGRGAWAAAAALLDAALSALLLLLLLLVLLLYVLA